MKTITSEVMRSVIFGLVAMGDARHDTGMRTAPAIRLPAIVQG